MQNKSPEILAPAGGMDALIAAVRSGADAVYLGGQRFNARRSAHNFDDEALEQAVRYCHIRGVKVYLTLNTLITDSEVPELLAQAAVAAAAGVDGILVQDFGVAQILKTVSPHLPLMASTQMTVHNVAGARAAKAMGMTRVVLARELSKDEIATITREGGIETEVFVHGALCMSVSGQCYLSAMLGGRSGNRGVCAQPCRLPFAGGGKEYALSLKDMSLVDHIQELAQMGVSSLKIEGRMKRPEYVAAAVTACRNALEGRAVDFEALTAVFARSGFTGGYYEGKPGFSMFGIREKEDVTAATGKLLGQLATLYRSERAAVPVDLELEMRADEPAALTIKDDNGHTARVIGDQPQIAQNHPTDEALARRGLEKMGGTPFVLRELACHIDPELMLPISALNTMRKEAIARLEEQRGAPHPIPFDASVLKPIAANPKRTGQPPLRVRLQNLGQLSPTIAEQAQMITVPLSRLADDYSWLAYRDKICAEIPPALFPKAERRVGQQLAALKGMGLKAVSAGNIGAVHLGRELGFTVYGDFNLNVLNSYTLAHLAELGVKDACLSIELNLKNLESMQRHLPVGIIAYGSIPLMTLRSCPLKGPKGCGDCRGVGALTDRKGNVFAVDCVEREYSRLLNTVPLWLADRLECLEGLDFATLYFTHESPGDCVRVLERYQHGGECPAGVRTGGLYFRNLL